MTFKHKQTDMAKSLVIMGRYGKETSARVAIANLRLNKDTLIVGEDWTYLKGDVYFSNSGRQKVISLLNKSVNQ